MFRLSAIFIAIAVAIVMYRFSAWRTARMLDQQSTLLNDPVLLELTRQMAAKLDLPQLKVHIYEISPVNGLASPDGRIFITRGFMDKYRAGEVTANEIASVIAHELGHVALGHSKRRMADFAAQNAIRVVLMAIVGRFIPFFGWYIVNMFISMLAARLSRNDEYEADAYAAALLTKSGIGITHQISLFRKLEKLAGGKGQQLAWFMSHPKAEERIAALEKLEAGWS